MSKEFEREERYLVLKRSDINSALDSELQQQLFYLAQKVESERHSLGKDILECVVVESDWSIYSDVWKMVEAVANNQPTELEQLRKDNLELMGFVSFVAGVMKNEKAENVSLHHITCRAGDILARQIQQSFKSRPSEKDIRQEITRIEGEAEYQLPSANLADNPSLCLYQCILQHQLNALKWVLGEGKLGEKL